MMIYVTRQMVVKPIVLDFMVRDVLALIDLEGIRTGGGNVTVDLVNSSSQPRQDSTGDLLDNYGALLVSADKTVMNEGDVDPVVTCADASISGDSDVGYIVLLDGAVYASGTTTIIADVATLNLVSPVDGIYEIFMYRTLGNYASGSVTITVSEV